MKFKLVKLKSYSGKEASIYSVYMEDLQKTLFDVFLEENKTSFKSELKDILKRMSVIGHKTGAREQFFKTKEGIPGDGVCALYDNPDKKLRLYCIRYGKQLVILGGGGQKPDHIQELQEDEKLKKENYLLRDISARIRTRTDEKEIVFINEGMDFEGKLEFDTEEDE